MPKILRGVFVVYVVAVALHLAWVVHHEPFAFDAWNVSIDTDRQPFSGGNFTHYWWFEYTHSNPRFGQALTYLAYKLDVFTEIATPLAYLAIALAVTMLGLGRWPSWRRGRDLALWAFAIGALWFALPQLGKTLFCRAYAANYVYGLAIQLWFLVPLRLAKKPPGALACALYTLLGLVAGMCNEHTGPTLCAFLVGYAWWLTRHRMPKARLAWLGALGAIAGFAALFFAPGQNTRYDDLAQRMSLVGRLLSRGVTGNLEIIRDLMFAVAPVLGLVALAAVLSLAERDPEHAERDRRKAAVRLIVGAIVAALAMAATIFVSPKLGSRFYLGSASLLLAGFIALADSVLSSRTLGWLVVLGVASSAYAAAHTMPLYAHAARASDARMGALALTQLRPHAGEIAFADSYDQVDDSWWFQGDDFRDGKKRALVAELYGLGGVVFHAYDPLAPLGVAGARFVPVATLDPPGCLDERAALALGPTKGFDLAGLDKELATAIEVMRAQLAPVQLRALAVEVTLDDPRLVMPRPHVVVAKWTAGGTLEAYAGAIERHGRETQREIALPKTLAGDFEIYVYQVGGEARRLGTNHEALAYTPWKTGVYWVLACRADECFVVAATRQGG